jgi:hypothetical protein
MLLGALMEWCIDEVPTRHETKKERSKVKCPSRTTTIADLVSCVGCTLKTLLLWSMALTAGVLFCGFYTSLDRDDPYMLFMVAFSAFSIPPTVASMTQRLYWVVLTASRFRQTTLNSNGGASYTLTYVVATSLTLPLDMLAYIMGGVATSAYLMLWNDVDAHQIFVSVMHLLHRYHWNRV